MFRGQSEDLGLRQVFWRPGSGSGAVCGKRPCPLSVWFIRFTATFFAPAIAKPIVYDVEVLRDGNSFSARRVAAIQNGKPIFYMTASFQAPENGYEHQKAMPAAPP